MPCTLPLGNAKPLAKTLGSGRPWFLRVMGAMAVILPSPRERASHLAEGFGEHGRVPPGVRHDETQGSFIAHPPGMDAETITLCSSPLHADRHPDGYAVNQANNLDSVGMTIGLFRAAARRVFSPSRCSAMGVYPVSTGS